MSSFYQPTMYIICSGGGGGGGGTEKLLTSGFSGMLKPRGERERINCSKHDIFVGLPFLQPLNKTIISSF